ncbi:Ser/Thr protein kinase RdoA (MazF antagonist) [Thermosporothrix hazakensis]|uniref:Ser/Thr protein kinase RdoA (MazF antagonist) n=2 Tax=Thermosporothrix TaxID=768650 RepID=A0A326UJV5_THEHA|nr:phosphotransferase [Thermosporothrix hazakensis]PZW29317.1 Ser/Thr protein kinase RdoA (MazF antagonist) [Thermosporothrix hazakensis]
MLYPFFPVAHSMLSAAALRREVLTHYGFQSLPDCILLSRGVNDSYLVRGPEERFTLRIYRAGWRSRDAIRYELELLHHLDQRGIAVSTPISREDGEYLTELLAPEGPRFAVLFSYAPGEPPDRHSVEDSYIHGRALAAMHNAADSFSPSVQREALDLSVLLDASLQTLEPLHSWVVADWASLEQFAEQGLDYGACHGDSHILNEHLDGARMVTLFDFDCCGPGWRAYDLATVRWCEGFYHMDPDDRLWRAFLKGYTELRPIEADQKRIPALVAIREIWR